LRRLLAAAALGLVASCARTPLSPADSLFAKVRRITPESLISKEAMENILEVRLSSTAHSNKYFTQFEASSSVGAIEQVDLRVPTELGRKGGFLVLTIDPKIAPIERGQVLTAFGKPSSERPDIVHSHGWGKVPDQLWTYLLLVYESKGFRRTFRFPAETERLTGVILDGNPD
jgi:hypothetical protein